MQSMAVRIRRVLMGVCCLALLVGAAMRWVGMPSATWVLGISAAAWVFLFLLPAMGGRSREPADSPLRRARWGD
jgi:uncharacterized membrane protein YkgB